MESPPDISKDLHRTLFSAVFVVMFFPTSIIQMSNVCKYGLRLYLVIDNPPTSVSTDTDIVFKDKTNIFSFKIIITGKQQSFNVKVEQKMDKILSIYFDFYSKSFFYEY